MKEEPNNHNEQIQRLADGQLGFEERARLLREIDRGHISKWREVALMLVERDILAEASVGSVSTRKAPATFARLAVAACLAIVCFALGRMMNAQPAGVQEVAQSVPASLPPLKSEAAYPVPSPALLLSTNEQLASSGYEASMLTRYVRANLDDGRQVVIPVSQVLLGYRGD